MTGWLGPILITGTDTGVGKTVVTAAIAASAQRAGLRVAMLKPAQTGGDDDATTVAAHAAMPAPQTPNRETPNLETQNHSTPRTATMTTRTLARYPEPLAPQAAARAAGIPPLLLAAAVGAVNELRADHDMVLVEGAGGVLVPMGTAGWTVRDLAVRCEMSVVVVTRAGLGTLNHTALTLEALAGLPTVVVLGSWPKVPELVHRSNLIDLRSGAEANPNTAGAQIAGAVPEGAGALAPDRFRAAAPGWLTPTLHGSFDVNRFLQGADALTAHP
ncbi:MAG: dethiobiotin synthase [Mycobacteriales bacterium]